MKRSEILENRHKWINFLKTNPQKFKCKLENFRNSEQRCCLGHACYVFGLKRIVSDKIYYQGTSISNAFLAPEELIDLIGLREDNGKIPSGFNLEGTDGNKDMSCDSLVEINDETDMSHKEIGEYLESVINGGDNSPFLPLEDFPE